MAKLDGVISNYLSKKLLDHSLKGTTYTPPANIYLGIASSSATKAQLAAGTLTHEITGYTGNRKEVSFGSAALADSGDALSDVESITTADAEFEDMPEATVAWALVCDAATGGNLLWALPLVKLTGVDAGEADPKEVGEGDTFRLPAENVIVFMGQRAV